LPSPVYSQTLQRRTKTLLTKLRASPNLLQMYNNIIQEQEQCGIIERVTDTSAIAGRSTITPILIEILKFF